MSDAASLPARRHERTPRAPRRATAMDRVRVREFARRLEAGEDEVQAFWAVASHSGFGYVRYRGTTERPSELILRRKMASLLERAAPGIVAGARDVALTRLAALSEDALTAVREVVTGDFTDGQTARTRLDAARTILGSLGVREEAPAASATANVLLSLGDGLRALRGVTIETTTRSHDETRALPHGD